MKSSKEQLQIGNSSYTLELVNAKGMVFNTYSVDELSDKSGYERLDELYLLSQGFGLSDCRVGAEDIGGAGGVGDEKGYVMEVSR